MGSVDIPKEFHTFISGPFGDTAKHIALATGAEVEIPSPRDKSSKISVSGEDAAVAMALDVIKGIYEEKKRTFQAVGLEVTKRLHRCLEKGQILQDILKNTAVTIEVPPKDSFLEKLTILGEHEKLGRVLPLLYEMFRSEVDSNFEDTFWKFAIAFNPGWTETEPKEIWIAESSVEVKVKSYILQFLVERLGTHIKVFSQWSVRIILTVPVAEQGKNEPPLALTIEGDENDVSKAQNQILDIMREMMSAAKDEVQIAQKHHRYFVAKKRWALNQTLKGLGPVVVSFPSITTTSDLVKLDGPKVCVEKARERMLRKVEELNSVVTIEFFLEERHRRAALNFTICTAFKQFLIKHEVDIKFPENSERVLITGLPGKCEFTKTALLDAKPVEIELDVPSRYRGAIIGKKGSQIRKIRETFGVEITLPKRDEESGNVVIAGGKDNAEKARQYILDMIQRLDKEKADLEGKVELHVDPKYHGRIIGRKGAVIAKIKAEYDVRVQFPKVLGEAAVDLSLITILGNETNTRSARDEILSLVNNIISTKKTYLDLNLEGIMLYDEKRMALTEEKFNVSIEMLSNLRSISVTGLIENVDAAIAHILMLEKEYLDELDAFYGHSDNIYSENKKRKLEFTNSDHSSTSYD
ncbi:Vigilin [Halotydeus destructor]|nr:Vigilin [Halotydeus destructor]